MKQMFWEETKRDGWREHRRRTDLADFLILEGTICDAVVVTRNKTVTETHDSLQEAKDWCVVYFQNLLLEELAVTFGHLLPIHSDKTR